MELTGNDKQEIAYVLVMQKQAKLDVNIGDFTALLAPEVTHTWNYS